jgi:hypothetical protein
MTVSPQLPNPKEARMTFRSISVTSVIVVTSLLAVPSARAECVMVSAKAMLEGPSTELAFSGRVVEIIRTADLGYRATFEVDRVWRGSLTKRFDLYVWEMEPEKPRFEVDRQYVAFAQRLSTRARQGVGLSETDPVAFTPVTCSDGYSLSPDRVRDTIQELGPGKSPKESGVHNEHLLYSF